MVLAETIVRQPAIPGFCYQLLSYHHRRVPGMDNEEMSLFVCLWNSEEAERAKHKNKQRQSDRSVDAYQKETVVMLGSLRNRLENQAR